MNIKELISNFSRRVYQRNIPDEELTKRVRQAIVQLASEGPEIEGLLAIFIKNGRIYVMEGGLQDDFEAGNMIQRAQYLINSQGLVTQ